MSISITESTYKWVVTKINATSGRQRAIATSGRQRVKGGQKGVWMELSDGSWVWCFVAFLSAFLKKKSRGCNIMCSQNLRKLGLQQKSMIARISDTASGFKDLESPSSFRKEINRIKKRFCGLIFHTMVNKYHVTAKIWWPDIGSAIGKFPPLLPPPYGFFQFKGFFQWVTKFLFCDNRTKRNRGNSETAKKFFRSLISTKLDRLLEDSVILERFWQNLDFAAREFHLWWRNYIFRGRFVDNFISITLKT